MKRFPYWKGKKKVIWSFQMNFEVWFFCLMIKITFHRIALLSSQSQLLTPACCSCRIEEAAMAPVMEVLPPQGKAKLYAWLPDSIFTTLKQIFQLKSLKVTDSTLGLEFLFKKSHFVDLGGRVKEKESETSLHFPKWQKLAARSGRRQVPRTRSRSPTWDAGVQAHGQLLLLS